MKIVKADIVEKIKRKTGFNFSVSHNILTYMMKTMNKGLARDGNLKITGFATFSVHQKNARPGRNPKTGEPVMIKPRKAVHVKVSDLLKKAANQKG